MDRDLYDVLGVPRTATEAQIRHAYWLLAKKYHPDVSHDDPDAARKFIEAQNAAETLLEPARRAAYDESHPAATPVAARAAARSASKDGRPPAASQPASPPETAPATPPASPPADSRLVVIGWNLAVLAVVAAFIAAFAFGPSHPKDDSVDVPNGTVIWKAADFSLDDGYGINLAGKGALVQIFPGSTAEIMVAGGYLSAGGHIASLPPGDAATYQHCLSAVEQSSDQSIPLVEIGPIIHGTLCLSGEGGSDLASIQVTRDDGSDLTFNITVWEYI